MRRLARDWWRVVIVAAADLVTVSVIAMIAKIAMGLGPSDVSAAWPWRVLWAVTFPLVTMLVFSAYGLYSRIQRRLTVWAYEDVSRFIHGALVSTLLIAGISYALGQLAGWRAPSLPELAIIWVLIAFPVQVSRAIVGLFAPVLLRPKRVLIAGTGMAAQRVAQRLVRRPDLNLLLVGYVDDGPCLATGAREGDPGVLGDITELAELCRDHEIDRVIVAFPQTPPRTTVEQLRRLPPGVSVSVIPELYELLSWRSAIESVDGIPIMDITGRRPSAAPLRIKRGLDLTLSLLLLPLAAPLFLAIAVAIKVTSSGPVFFKQQRTGWRGRSFDILKFRTMMIGADMHKVSLAAQNHADGPLFKIRRDPRVTRLGRFLRSTSLDELPQLINVVKGEMSLVGPRPFVIPESSSLDGWAARRFEMRPGMTGLWQISGRTELAFEELRTLDFLYVSTWSLGWDLRILVATPSVVLRRRSGY